MIHSMTGYASVTTDGPYGSLQLELKSVNSRFLDLQFRVPDEMRALEPGLREAIAAKVSRGKVECRINTAPLAAEYGRSLTINRGLLDELLALERQVKDAAPDKAGLEVADLLRWPGMLGDAAWPLEHLRAEVARLTAGALDELCATRRREGDKLAALIGERVEQMLSIVAKITPLLPQFVAAFQDKLALRLREALVSDDERLRQEVVLFAARIDVAEELGRLATHLHEVLRVLRDGGAAGKRLDFLMQELNREANTLGAKSVSSELSNMAMEMKLLIEQMREQVQNIE
jgi:uncharacterized protein (TIGR00255 family)